MQQVLEVPEGTEPGVWGEGVAGLDPRGLLHPWRQRVSECSVASFVSDSS